MNHDNIFDSDELKEYINEIYDDSKSSDEDSAVKKEFKKLKRA